MLSLPSRTLSPARWHRLQSPAGSSEQWKECGLSERPGFPSLNNLIPVSPNHRHVSLQDTSFSLCSYFQCLPLTRLLWDSRAFSFFDSYHFVQRGRGHLNLFEGFNKGFNSCALDAFCTFLFFFVRGLPSQDVVTCNERGGGKPLLYQASEFSGLFVTTA